MDIYLYLYIYIRYFSQVLALLKLVGTAPV